MYKSWDDCWCFSNIEKGKVIPRSGTLLNICKVLGVSMDRIMADNKEIDLLDKKVRWEKEEK